jgi:hypothetical protein
MKHEMFEERYTDTGELVRKYAVITDWEDTKRSHDKAQAYVASKVFKCKRDKVASKVVYMNNKDSNELSFTKENGTEPFIAVYRV